MKIYVVTSGAYSDYCINQVFLSREKALAFIKSREAEYRYDDPGIEVYDTYDDRIEMTDGYLDNTYMACSVYCDLENEGRWYVDFWQTVCYERKQPEIHEFYDWRGNGELLKIKVELTVQPQFEDSLIIKIAQDEYAKWKAEREENK
jgi:hypothetical protein